MKLSILEEEYVYENNRESIISIFDRIKEVIDFTEYNFDHMIVDGEEVYDDFEFYIEDNIEDINEVTVVLFTDREIITDNINTAKEYIKGAIPLIEDLAKNSSDNEKNCDDLKNLYEAILWIINNFKSIDGFEIKSEIISNYAVWNELLKEVGLLEDCLNKGYDSIANILDTDIIPIFKRMNDNLQYIKISV